MKTISAVLLASIMILWGLITSQACAQPKKVQIGETVTLEGEFVILKGEDIQERPVTYNAIKFIEPIVVIYDDSEDKVDSMKLWFTRDNESLFKKWKGKKVRATGTVDYYWFGPSTMPNPAKFDLINVNPK